MSYYSNPTVHHENITEEVKNITGGAISLFRKNITDALSEQVMARMLDPDFIQSWRDETSEDISGYGRFKIDDIESTQKWLKMVIPDAYSITYRDDGVIDINIYEITATNRINYNKLMKYETITEFIEETGDANVYLYVIEPTTRSYSILDCDMAQHRIERRKNDQWVDYSELIDTHGRIEELSKISTYNHHEYNKKKPRKNKTIHDFNSNDEWFEYIKNRP